jgi:uncharacterized protein YgbK (DUF1537 family)
MLELGCIADDFTGATDLASTRVRVRQAQCAHSRTGLIDGLVAARGADQASSCAGAR